MSIRRAVALLLCFAASSLYAQDGGDSVSSQTTPDSHAGPPVEVLRSSRHVGDQLTAMASVASAIADIVPRSSGARKCIPSPCQDPSLTLAVAISGGGLRAANFALGALLALEQVSYGRNGSNLHHEIDYFSTVSGGGLAAATSVVARLQAHRFGGDEMQPLQAALTRDRQRFLGDLRQPLRRFLMMSMLKPTTLLGRRTRGDDLQLLLDRTLLCPFLDEGECASLDSNTRLTLGRIFNIGASSQPRLPYWFINTTDISTGEIIPLSPDRLARDKVTAYWHKTRVPIVDEREFRDVPVALALRSSMNFPPAIPATRLERATDRPYLFLTDGGESDNLGVVTATAALAEEQRRSSERKRRLLIVIDAHQGTVDEYDGDPNPPSTIQSLLRATMLPLDAHRFRVRQDYDDANASRLSILDALSDRGDLSVVYIDLSGEEDAGSVDTLTVPTADVQTELICAGSRSTVRALALSEEQARIDIGLECEDHDYDRGRGMLVFNRQGKEDFATLLMEELHEARIVAMKAADAFKDRITETLSEALWNKERDKLNVRMNLSDLDADVRLGSEDVNKMALYRHIFEGVHRGIADGGVKRRLGEKKEEGAGTKRSDAGPSPSARLATKFMRTIADAVQAVLAYFGFGGDGDEDGAATDASPPGESKEEKQVEDSLRDDLLAILATSIVPSAKAIEDSLTGSETSLSDVIDHLKQLEHAQRNVFELLEGRSIDPPTGPYSVLREAYKVLSTPAELRAALEERRREAVTAVMPERGKEFAKTFEGAWEKARCLADRQMSTYKMSDFFLGIADMSSRLEPPGGGEQEERDVCNRLRAEIERAEAILMTFPPKIDVAGGRRLEFLPVSLGDEDLKHLATGLEGARSKVEEFRDRAKRTRCLYPDSSWRDEVEYGVFDDRRASFSVDAECDDAVWYRRACKEPRR